MIVWLSYMKGKVLGWLLRKAVVMYLIRPISFAESSLSSFTVTG
jgi:hypothetical protein